jgi:para-nitrobenzyl esterase
VREAAQAGPAVPQAASRLERVMGPPVPDWNEDGSLTVNVHTPLRAFEDHAAARPHLVWWHGGGLTSGSGSGGWDWYDGGDWPWTRPTRTRSPGH